MVTQLKVPLSLSKTIAFLERKNDWLVLSICYLIAFYNHHDDQCTEMAGTTQAHQILANLHLIERKVYSGKR
jgi:hypothetical protein